MQSPKKFSGFTLIELLIVVAIIAILAAIAVPNFLEAQTRAKVSRSVADMRSINVALECYRTDLNCYPYQPQWNNPGWDDPNYWMVPLTTPVAYITSLPKYTWKPLQLNWGPPRGPFMLDYYYYQDRKSFGSGFFQWNIWDKTDKAEWYISAVGPDGDLDLGWQPEPGSNNLPYDPTNGTNSHGDIIRTGP